MPLQPERVGEIGAIVLGAGCTSSTGCVTSCARRAPPLHQRRSSSMEPPGTLNMPALALSPLSMAGADQGAHTRVLDPYGSRSAKSNRLATHFCCTRPNRRAYHGRPSHRGRSVGAYSAQPCTSALREQPASAQHRTHRQSADHHDIRSGGAIHRARSLRFTYQS
jgi:hypothetical protein